MQFVRFLTCLTCLGILSAFGYLEADANNSEPLEIRIQMIPGIWITGASGPVRIEYTTDLNHNSGWTFLARVQATNSPYFYVDKTATNMPNRFYRALSEHPIPENPDQEHLVWIYPGTFMMGSPITEKEGSVDEGPQIQVTITKGFWISKFEVTQKEYLAVMKTNPSSFTGDLNLPVDSASWFDATNYCAKLTQLEHATGRLPTGYAYRLPTEAEWEYACRAGTTTRYCYGNDLENANLVNSAWYSNNSAKTTHPVGQKQPNAWGLYDMHGNLWEWCLDWYGTYPTRSVTDPKGAATGSFKILRGGCWYDDGRFLRSANRGCWLGGNGYYLGFRPVLALEN